jgi:hypothetical protein
MEDEATNSDTSDMDHDVVYVIGAEDDEDIEDIIKLSEKEMIDIANSFPHTKNGWFKMIKDEFIKLINETKEKLADGHIINVDTSAAFFEFSKKFNKWTSMGNAWEIDQESVIRCVCLRIFLGEDVELVVRDKNGEPIESDSFHISYNDHPVFEDITKFLVSIEDLLVKDPSEYVEKLTEFADQVRSQFVGMNDVNWSDPFISACRMKCEDIKYLRDMIVKTFSIEKHYMEKVLPAEKKRIEAMMNAHNVE